MVQLEGEASYEVLSASLKPGQSRAGEHSRETIKLSLQSEPSRRELAIRACFNGGGSSTSCILQHRCFQFMGRSRTGRSIHGNQSCLRSLYDRSPLHAAPELLLDVDSNTAVCFVRYFGNESQLDPLKWKIAVSSTLKNMCVSCRVPLHATPGLVYAADTSQDMRNRNFVCLGNRALS
jgi:hypothetical protein